MYNSIFGVTRHAPKINRYSNRPTFVDDRRNPCNDSKFENINRSPACLSKNKHMPVMNFAKLTKRNFDEIFMKKTECNNEYEKWTESKEKFGMQKLDRVSIDMKMKAGRTLYGGFYKP